MAIAQVPRDIVKSVLLDVFVNEARLVGSENLEDLCQGLDFDDDDGGHRLSVGDTLALLANAVTVIAYVWPILRAQRARRKAAAEAAREAEDIDRQVLAALPESAALPKERRLAIYLSLMARR